MRLSSVTSLAVAALLLVAAAPTASALAGRAGSSKALGGLCDPGRVEVQTMSDGVNVAGFQLIAEKSTKFVVDRNSPKYAGSAQGCQGARIWVRMNYVYEGVASVAYASLSADANYTLATGSPGQMRFNATNGNFYPSVDSLTRQRGARIPPPAIEETTLVSTSVIISREAPKGF